MGKAKPFDIPKREVWEAFKRVKANQGAAGVDGQSIAEFEVDLSNGVVGTTIFEESGSHMTRWWRKEDSNPRSPLSGHGVSLRPS